MVSSEVEDIRAKFKKNHKTREMVSHSSKVKTVKHFQMNEVMTVMF